MADVGMAQIQSNGVAEVPLLTAGDDLNNSARIIPKGKDSYSALEVIKYLVK